VQSPRLLLLPLLFLLLVAFREEGQYAAEYPAECQAALRFRDEHDAEFQAAARAARYPADFLFAIVAPEYTRYHYLRDRLESYSLKVLYVQGGASYANFSVGCFQMKPSFIEKLEQRVASDSLLRGKHAACLFADPGSRASRVTRLKRLSSVEWQLAYLVVFLDVVDATYPRASFADDEERLRFYATVYNRGFHETEQQLRAAERFSLFPRSARQYRYSDVSVWFYRQSTNARRS
jgi:hypothetical protein